MPADSLLHLSLRLLRLRSMPAAATAVTISAWIGVPLKPTLLARKSNCASLSPAERQLEFGT
jgi:hypothetical protein